MREMNEAQFDRVITVFERIADGVEDIASRLTGLENELELHRKLFKEVTFACGTDVAGGPARGLRTCDIGEGAV